ncbi:MAG: type IV pilin N-terminal domain-containing protein [Haloferacaceae archaeon]
MQLNAFLEDREAVSPVIGVILMVAITVILAAVIGTFVLGLGDQIGDAAPNANWDAEFDGTDTVTFTHGGGDQVDPDTLRVTASGDPGIATGATDHDDQGNVNASSVDDPLTAGSSITVELVTSSGDEGTVSLVWESGDRSSIMRSIDVSVP